MDKIRYGIIGFGAQGSSYCNILTGTPAFPGFPAAAIPAHCELGAICAIAAAKREAAAAKFPNVPVYEDYKDMIASGKLVEYYNNQQVNFGDAAGPLKADEFVLVDLMINAK